MQPLAPLVRGEQQGEAAGQEELSVQVGTHVGFPAES
jgi:hypothetical protein